MKKSENTREQVTCRICGTTYVPNFINDFYPDGDDSKVGRCERCMISEVFAPKPPSDVPLDHHLSVCKFGQGPATCAFLVLAPAGSGKLRQQCAKQSDAERIIRERLAAGTMGAKGDNCSGPPGFTPN